MIKGRAKDNKGSLITWELTENEKVTIKSISLGFNREFNGEYIICSDQVIRLIDDEIIMVKEYQVSDGPWIRYR